MSYLLGFPTPVIEILGFLVILFIALSIYFGTKFEGTDPERLRHLEDEAGSTETPVTEPAEEVPE